MGPWQCAGTLLGPLALAALAGAAPLSRPPDAQWLPSASEWLPSASQWLPSASSQGTGASTLAAPAARPPPSTPALRAPPPSAHRLLQSRRGAAAADPAPTTPPPVKVPKDATQAVIQMISQQQDQMFTVIAEANKDLQATDARITKVLAAANRSAHLVDELVQKTNKLNETALRNEEMEKTLIIGFPGIVRVSNITVANAAKVNATLGSAWKQVETLKKMESAKPRADDGMRILKLLKPRLEKLDDTVLGVEVQLYGGNTSKFVEEGVEKQLTDVMEDTGRAFASDLSTSG